MTCINGDFNFKNYDNGGNNAKANNGKLTGDEVAKARQDGWNVYEGMPENITPGKLEESMANNSILAPKTSGGYDAEYVSAEKAFRDVSKLTLNKSVFNIKYEFLKQQGYGQN